MIDRASEAAGVELSENGGRGVGYVGWGWGGGVGVCYSGFRGPSLGLSVDFEVSLEHSQMGAFCLDVARPLPWRPFHPFWSGTQFIFIKPPAGRFSSYDFRLTVFSFTGSSDTEKQ